MVSSMQAKIFIATPSISHRRMRHALDGVIAALREWRRRSQSRVALAAFDERMLRDIGLTRCEAANEIDKPFWMGMMQEFAIGTATAAPTRRLSRLRASRRALLPALERLELLCPPHRPSEEPWPSPDWFRHPPF
jgi:uncharacterized protein YjiS (DUF1127 family)